MRRRGAGLARPPKKASASTTDIASTSAMFRPPRVYSSTAAWNRRPSHSSQVDSTVAMMPRSVKITPAPLQVGQAPSELELNSAGLTPLALAKALRIGSSRPV